MSGGCPERSCLLQWLMLVNAGTY